MKKLNNQINQVQKDLINSNKNMDISKVFDLQSHTKGNIFMKGLIDSLNSHIKNNTSVSQENCNLISMVKELKI